MSHFFLLEKSKQLFVAGALILLAILLLPGASTAQGLADPKFDLTRNGVIDDADAAAIISAWTRLQEAGQCITPDLVEYDLNQDGCINIFDVQMLLAHWGELTRPEPPSPEIGALATATFIVNSNGTRQDANPGDGKCDTGSTVTVSGNTSPECTLRAAIEEANNRPGPERIEFRIRNSDGSCPNSVTINSSSSLDLIIDAPDDAAVTIDGYTQCGASPNTGQVSGNAVIKVQIQGSSRIEGLVIFSANNVIRGLAIYGSESDLKLYTSGAHHNTIQGNILGTDASFNSSSTGYGLNIRKGASHNLVGGDQPHQRNIIGGSSEDSIAITGRGSPVKFNIIIGNYIGVRQNGKTSAGNRADGVDISEGALYNWVGARPPSNWPPPGWKEGDPLPPPDPNRNYNPAERNVIGYNGRDGLEISHATNTQYNYVVNNYIGLAANGQDAAPNGTSSEGGNGLTFEDLVNHNFIYNNVIVHSGSNGIRGYVSNYNQIVNNAIGVGPDRTTAMPNGTHDPKQKGRRGVFFFHGSKNNLIKNNTIAYNLEHGVMLSRQTISYLEESDEDPAYKDNRTSYNTISQNSIFHNGQAGIRLRDGTNENIGTPTINSALLNNTGIIEVRGTSCSNCIIEVFKAVADNDGFDSKGGEGQTFLGQTTAASNGSFSLNVSGLQTGNLVTATATDAAGNTSEFGRNTEVTDGQRPSGGLLLNGGDDHNSAYRAVLARFFAQDDTSITHWRYSINNSTLPNWSPVPSPGPNFVREEILTLSGGSHTVYAQYRDNSGLASSVYQASITVIAVGDPNNPGNGKLTINGGAVATNNPNLSLQLIGPLYTAEMEIAHVSNQLNGANWEPYLVQRSWPLDNPPATSTSYTLYARFKTASGAITPITNDTILFDPVAPTAVASFNPQTRVVNLSGSRDDPGGSGLGQMNIFNGAYNSGWIAYNSTFTWPSSDSRNIQVRVRDRAGNTSGQSGVIQLGGPNSLYLPILSR